MYVDTLPSKSTLAAVKSVGMHGRAELGFEANGEQTKLKHLYQASPLRVLFPTLPKTELNTAVLVTTSGGLVGGDQLEINLTAEANSKALVMGQAAEKVYRSVGPDTFFNTDIKIHDGAYLEWLPQETIVFDQARLRRTTRVDIAETGQFTGAEMLVFGRTAMGENVCSGLVRDVWDIRKNGKRLWADALHLDGDIKSKLDHPAGFDGARAVATFIHVSSDAENHLDFARELLDHESDVRTGATISNSVLVVRWLAKDTLQLRNSFGKFWAAFRAHTQNLPGKMPRLWHV